LTKQGRGQEKEGKEYGEKKSHGGLVLRFQLNPTLLQSPQILNTTQKDQPDQGNQTPTPNGREGFRETGEGDLWIQMDCFREFC